MKIEIKVPTAMPCRPEVFKINGVNAELEDFGSIEKEQGGWYSCKNIRFQHKLPTTAVLQKYRISLEQYAEVVRELERRLDLHSCSMCR
jgi:hypothetical protein